MNEQYTRAPHRRSQPQSGPSPNAALLIDFDNVTMAMRSNLGAELRNFLSSDIVRGKVSVQRAYADWRRYPQYIVPLAEASIDLIFAPAYGSSKKNATDIRLAIDALELVFTRPEIGTLILLSGDSDFSSLVLKLKEYGKYVIGVGLQESTSDLLVQNCDEYYSYNSLSGLTSAEEISSKKHDPWELVEKAAHRMNERSDVMRSDRLKQVMLELDGTFDEKDLGFNKFNRFLAEASSRGLVQLRKIGDGHYEIAPKGRKPEHREERTAVPETGDGRGAEDSGREERAPSREREPSGRGRGRGRAPASSSGGGGDAGRRPSREPAPEPPPEIEAASLKGAYDLLRDVVRELSDGRGAVRDSEVKREMLRREGDFDEAALGFSKFSRFLRQAYDEEVVELATDPDGNYPRQPDGAPPISFEEPGDGGDGGEDREKPPRDRAEPAPSGERGRTAETPSAEPESGTAAAEVAETEVAEAEEPGRTTPEARQEETPRRRGGLGRFRRGSRSGPRAEESAESDDSVPGAAVGPVDDSGDSDASDGDDGDAGGHGSPSDRGESRDSRPRGSLGRFRRGRNRLSERDDEGSGDGEGPSMGPVDRDERSDAGDDSPASSATRSTATDGDDEGAGVPDKPAASRSADRPPASSGPVGDPVSYMIGNYPGVGRKTAEKLVEAFGDEVFEVIDRHPQRLSEVLPEHRAQAVVEAREAERGRVEA